MSVRFSIDWAEFSEAMNRTLGSLIVFRARVEGRRVAIVTFDDGVSRPIIEPRRR